jgi:hypothetical protein
MACESSLGNLARRGVPCEPFPEQSSQHHGHHHHKSSSALSLSSSEQSVDVSVCSALTRSTLQRCFSEAVLHGLDGMNSQGSSPRSSACSSPGRRSVASDSSLYMQAPWVYEDFVCSQQRPPSPCASLPALSRSNSGSLGGSHPAPRRVCSQPDGRLGAAAAGRRKDVQPSSLRRIFKAKQVLAEVARIHMACPDPAPFCVKRGGGVGAATGAADASTFSLIIRLLGGSTDQQQTLDYLETLTVLAADDGSREVLLQQGAEEAVVELLAAGRSSTAVQCCALDALASISRGHRRQFWLGPGCQALLATLQQQHQPPSVLLCALATIGALALGVPAAADHAAELLEPSVVPALARLLGPSTDPACLLACLALLQRIARDPAAAGLPGWRCCTFQAVSLLSPGARHGSEVVHEALQLLLALSDSAELQGTICASGLFAPLLALLQNRDGRLALGASCLLSALAESACGQSALVEEGNLCALLHALQGRQPVDVRIGVLYALRCLAQAQPGALAALRQHAAVPLLLRLLHVVTDEDAVLGALNLLSLLGYQHHGVRGCGASGGGAVHAAPAFVSA